MKVDNVIELLQKEAGADPDIQLLISALKKHQSLRVAILAEKIGSMRVPKVDIDKAINELKTDFQNSERFESKLASIAGNRAYTKAILHQIFKSLFPKVPPPAAKLTKPKLVQEISEQRIREENYATA